MLKDQTETRKSSGAEALSSESDLAVGVHVDVFDEAMAAVKAAAATLDDSLHRWGHLVSVCFLDLPVDVFEDRSDHPDHSDDERAEKKTADIVSD